VRAETSESTYKSGLPALCLANARAADEMLLGERGVHAAAKRARPSAQYGQQHTHSNAFYNDNSVQVLLIIAASSEARAPPPGPLAADTDDFAW
jgi:hypothetical protein